MPFAQGKGTRAPVSLVPTARAVLLTKEDLENFQSNAFNRDSAASLMGPVASAPSTAQQGPPSGWPPRRRTRSASTRRVRGQEMAAVVPAPVVTPGNGMVFYSAPAPSAGLSSMKKPSRVVRAKTLSRMDRISPEPSPPEKGEAGGLVLQGHDIRRMCGGFPEPRVDAEPAPSPEVAESACSRFLQVTQIQPRESPERSEPFEDVWTASEAEESDSGGEVFDVRRYRFANASPNVQRRQRSKRTRPVDGEEELRAWEAWQELPPAAPESDEEEDERRDVESLQRVAQALVGFYGLPEVSESIRLRKDVVNVVEVKEEAWKLRQRPSQLERPMMWVRGNRVYDFHGDRGTVAEFETDFLQRQVEDDATCRSRRQKQGLLPFPFLPLPLPQKEKTEEEEKAKR